MKQSIIFDTLEYLDQLKNSGIEQEQAEAITKATAKAFSQLMENQELVTKTDLKLEIQNLKMELQSFIVKSVVTTITILGGLQALFHWMSK